MLKADPYIGISEAYQVLWDYEERGEYAKIGENYKPKRIIDPLDLWGEFTNSDSDFDFDSDDSGNNKEATRRIRTNSVSRYE